MIDIGVRSLQAPDLRVSRKLAHHVLMDQPLQLDTHSPVTTHHTVGANSQMLRHITVRIRNDTIASIVSLKLLRAFDCRAYNPRTGILRSIVSFALASSKNTPAFCRGAGRLLNCL